MDTNANFDFVVVQKSTTDDDTADEYLRIVCPIPLSKIQSHLAQREMSETTCNCVVKLRKISSTSSVKDQNVTKMESTNVQDDENVTKLEPPDNGVVSEEEDFLKVVCPVPISKINKAQCEMSETTSVCIVKLGKPSSKSIFFSKDWFQWAVCNMTFTYDVMMGGRGLKISKGDRNGAKSDFFLYMCD